MNIVKSGGIMLVGIGAILIILGVIIPIFMMTDNNHETKKVDCYDRNNNKIVGAVCEQEDNTPLENISISLVMMIMGAITIFGGIQIINLGDEF